MNQILIKVYIPGIEKSYEVWIPPQKRIYNLIILLVKAISELNDNSYRPRTMPMLYDKNTSEMYDVSNIIAETKIKNGTELILI
jgi:hypothetical protein